MKLSVTPLEDRLTPANTTVPAGEFNWMQATPTGGIAQLVWEGETLTYRTRIGTEWSPEAITTSTWFGSETYFEPYRIEGAVQSAQLAFTPDGTPHVFLLGRDTVNVVYHYQRSSAGWALRDTIALGPGSFFGLDNLTSAVGPNGVIHLLIHVGGRGRDDGDIGEGTLYYATNKSGSWVAAPAITTGNLSNDLLFGGQRYVPRFLSIAADSQNFAHITYSTGFLSGGSFSTVASGLGYATNKSGTWVAETVYYPPDGTGDAGTGASIAIAPGDVPSIASYFVDRVATGSPASSQLLYHQRTPSGWASTVAVAQSDGYVAGDGPQFTGFAPQLRFEGGTPVIIFSDEGAQHLPLSFANEMAGQIRETRFTGGGWATHTVFRQTNPLVNEVYFPVTAVFNGQPIYAALQAVNVLDGNLEILSTTYTMIEVNVPSLEGPEPGIGGGPPGAGVVGADAGGGPVVKVFDRAGNRTATFFAFDPSFTGGVRVASGDVTGDGIDDIVAATGPGTAARVRVFQGPNYTLVLDRPVLEGFSGGLFVAVGDITGDTIDDIVITPDQGGGPRVLLLRGGTYDEAASFFGITDDAFRGGARAAIGDLNHDGRADLIVSAGFGGGPRVAFWDGKSITTAPTKMLNDFFVFEEGLRNGLYPAIGDIDNDGYAEFFAGAGPGGGPRVLVLSGRTLIDSGSAAAMSAPKANFFAGNSAARGGVRVATVDLDGDTRADLLTGSGGGNTRTLAYTGTGLAAGSSVADRDFFAFPGLASGVFVG
ncbi:MAG: VCBS repeat-containing protein [Gemmataceae bacterium]